MAARKKLILTGLTQANVLCDDGTVEFVRQGEELPDNLGKGVEARLRKLGAFNKPPSDQVPPSPGPVSAGSPTGEGGTPNPGTGEGGGQGGSEPPPPPPA